MDEVRTFESGAIRDSLEGKESYVESISWLTMKRYAQYMTKAASKYGRGNWIKGIPAESYEDSLIRHIQKYLSNKYYGTEVEPEVDHLSAALFNLQGLIHNEEVTKIDKKKILV